MLNALFLVLLILISHSVDACVVPRFGEEFNALVVVEGPDENDRFKVTVPRKLEGYKYSARIALSYAKERENSGYWFEEFTKVVKTRRKGNDLIGYFSIERLKDHKVSISVFWPPNASGLCGTYAGARIPYGDEKN